MRSPFRKASLLNHVLNFHQLPPTSHLDIPSKQNRPKQQHKSTRLRLPSPLWRSLSPPEDSPNSRRIGGCSDAWGPADLLAPSGPCDKGPPPAGWAVDVSRVASYAVARWALCNVLVVKCGPLIGQTSKPANLRIWSARDGIVGTKKPGWRLLLDRVQSGTHDRCSSQSSIYIVTSCKTMLIYPCTQLNKLSPIKAWIPEKKFLNCSSETGKARKLTRALVLANRELPAPSTLPQPPQPRLLQLALFVQENGQVVNRDERLRVLGSQLGLEAFQCSAVQPFSLAARGGALRWWNMEGTGLVEGRSSWTRLIFQAPFQNFLNSLQSALKDHQNHFLWNGFWYPRCTSYVHSNVPQWAPNQCTDICFHNHNGFHGGLVACLSDFKEPRPCGKCFTVKLKPKPVPHVSSACQGLFCIDNPQETIIIRVPT